MCGFFANTAKPQYQPQSGARGWNPNGGVASRVRGGRRNLAAGGGGRTGASNRRLRQAAQVFSLRVFLAKSRLTLVRGEGVPTGTVYAETVKRPSLRIRYLSNDPQLFPPELGKFSSTGLSLYRPFRGCL